MAAGGARTWSKLDIPHDDHVFVVNREYGLIDEHIGIDPVACQQLVIHARYSIRRVFQPFPRHILAECVQQAGYGFADLRSRHAYAAQEFGCGFYIVHVFLLSMDARSVANIVS